MAKPVIMMTVADIAYLRAGHMCPLGWTLKDDSPKRAVTCRCCGEKIAKGQPAKSIYLSFNDNYSCYCCMKVWLHESCQPADGFERVRYAR